jgi:hypothetical protein
MIFIAIRRPLPPATTLHTFYNTGKKRPRRLGSTTL